MREVSWQEEIYRKIMYLALGTNRGGVHLGACTRAGMGGCTQRPPKHYQQAGQRAGRTWGAVPSDLPSITSKQSSVRACRTTTRETKCRRVNKRETKCQLVNKRSTSSQLSNKRETNSQLVNKRETNC
jgi:hypothetical protein